MSTDEAPLSGQAVSAEVLLLNLRRFSEILSEISQIIRDMVARGDQEVQPPYQLYEFFHAMTMIGLGMAAHPEKVLASQQKLMQSMMEISSRYLENYTRSEEADEDKDSHSSDEATHLSLIDEALDEAPLFGFLQESYEALSLWASDQVEGLDIFGEGGKRKGSFYLRQLLEALSPRNFLFSNRELLRETLAQNGDNLVRGIEMFRDDLKAGHGLVKIRQTDAESFHIGENLAATEGQVVFRNELMELIQYQPTTPEVSKRPLLVVPPWINKYYVLDMTAQKSFVKWMVDQGLTVFIISWVNPDIRHRHKGWEAFMKEGPVEALEVIRSITGEKEVDAVGYCVGGTLLSLTQAWLSAKKAATFSSLSLLTTQVDFELAGELLVFIDEPQILAMERDMAKTGYLASGRMALTFNLLRSSDLIWHYVINNYLRGEKPKPFDLLYWNSDSTRMTEANHSFYLRSLYKDNLLSQGKIVIDGITIDLGKIRTPVYNMAAREDHIAPACSVYKGKDCFGGDMTLIVAGGGHIAGVVNPPYKTKYYFLSEGDSTHNFEGWLKSAKRQEGSWWPHWHHWLRSLCPQDVLSRQPGSKDYPPLEAAPGSYVRIV